MVVKWEFRLSWTIAQVTSWQLETTSSSKHKSVNFGKTKTGHYSQTPTNTWPALKQCTSWLTPKHNESRKTSSWQALVKSKNVVFQNNSTLVYTWKQVTKQVITLCMNFISQIRVFHCSVLFRSYATKFFKVWSSVV